MLMGKIKDMKLNIGQNYNVNETGLYWNILPEKLYTVYLKNLFDG